MEKKKSFTLHKDLEIVVICLYNIDEENVDMCRFLEDLHDKPLLNRE